MKCLAKNSCSSLKDPSVLPTIHPLVEFLRGWLILNLENIHSRTTAPTSVNTFVQTPRNYQFLTRLREIRSQTSTNDDDLVNYTIAPLMRLSVQTPNGGLPINQRAHWSIQMHWTSQVSFTFDRDWIFREYLSWGHQGVIWFVTVQWLDFERVPVLKTLWPNRASKTLIYSPPLNQDRTRLYAFSY